MCKRYEPKYLLYQCIRCNISVHQCELLLPSLFKIVRSIDVYPRHLTACYGVADGISLQHWLCDLCEREKIKDRLVSVSASFALLHSIPAALDHTSPFQQPSCVLCPTPLPDEDIPSPLTALDLLKPTEMGQYVYLLPSAACPSPLLTLLVYSYVHLLCAVYHPELRFTEPSRLEIVEGFASLPQRRAKEVCHQLSSRLYSHTDETRVHRLVLCVYKKEQELRFLVLVALSTSTSLVHSLRTTSSHSRYKHRKPARRNRRKLLRFDSRKKKVSLFSLVSPSLVSRNCLSEDFLIE